MNKLYSFDLFDTLVTRKLNHPKDVFTLVESTGVVKFRFFLNVFFTFKVLRVFSEKFSRFLKKNKKEDINIFDIYRVLGFFIKNPKEVLRKEIEIELCVIYPLEKNIKKLNELILEKKRICIVSDMYLTGNIIKKILKKNKISISLIYISSEIGLTKSSGNIFKFIAQHNEIELSEIIHYGDNIHSDINVPKRLGVSVVHVGFAQYRESHGFLDCFKSPIQEDLYYKLGYEFCGKIAYIFSHYINNNIKGKNIVFGARDSYLFKFAFELFFNQDEHYETFYTRISRQLVYLPEVYFSKSYERLFFETMYCDDFFSRIDLPCPESLRGKSVWLHKKKINFFLTHHRDFNEKLKEDALVVKEYLASNGFNKNVYFIDLGWKGSIQDSLNIIFNDNSIDVMGLYVGMVNKHSKKKGFLFNNKKSYYLYFYVMQCISLFEFLFTEPKRSLQKIKKMDDNYFFTFTDDESDFQVDSRKRIKAGAEQFLLDFFELNNQINFKFDYVEQSVKQLIYTNLMCIKDDFSTAFSNLSHSAGFNASLQSNLIEFSNFSVIGYLTAPWKAYFMSELHKKSKIKYFIFIILFHNVFFFVFYEYFKIFYRKVRGLIYG
ncbi:MULTISPECIES: HAD-IA family hydrolase [Acinetobacter]|uniref:HAD-IA family hydrolase n=1 Tax=Acinetobacter TaxID=469 RepID=UPI0002D05DB5|nr:MULTISPECIES: HAD-IA family hydrolase [Acinetobacter]ENX56512.1 hypothetical protein F885_03895 [Acinetobacter higginsii]